MAYEANTNYIPPRRAYYEPPSQQILAQNGYGPGQAQEQNNNYYPPEQYAPSVDQRGGYHDMRQPQSSQPPQYNNQHNGNGRNAGQAPPRHPNGYAPPQEQQQQQQQRPDRQYESRDQQRSGKTPPANYDQMRPERGRQPSYNQQAPDRGPEQRRPNIVQQPSYEQQQQQMQPPDSRPNPRSARMYPGEPQPARQPQSQSFISDLPPPPRINDTGRPTSAPQPGRRESSPGKLTMEEWKAKERARMHAESAMPDTLAQDNAFPLFPTKRDRSKARSGTSSARASGELPRPATSASNRHERRSSKPRTYSDAPAAVNGPQQQSRPPLDRSPRSADHAVEMPTQPMSPAFPPKGQGPVLSFVRNATTSPVQEPAQQWPAQESRKPVPAQSEWLQPSPIASSSIQVQAGQLQKPYQSTSELSQSARPPASMQAQSHAPPLTTSPPPQYDRAPASFQAEAVGSTQSLIQSRQQPQRGTAPQAIDTRPTQQDSRPAYLDHKPLSPTPVQARPSTSHGQRSSPPQPMTSPPPLLAQSDITSARSRNISTELPKALPQQQSHRVNLAGSSAQYQSVPVHSVAITAAAPLSREQEIEAEMPDFDSAAPGGTSLLHKRSQQLKDSPPSPPPSMPTAPTVPVARPPIEVDSTPIPLLSEEPMQHSQPQSVPLQSVPPQSVPAQMQYNQQPIQPAQTQYRQQQSEPLQAQYLQQQTLPPAATGNQPRLGENPSGTPDAYVYGRPGQSKQRTIGASYGQPQQPQPQPPPSQQPLPPRAPFVDDRPRRSMDDAREMPYRQRPPAQQLPVQRLPAQQIPAQQFPVQQFPAQQLPAQQFPPRPPFADDRPRRSMDDARDMQHRQRPPAQQRPPPNGQPQPRQPFPPPAGSRNFSGLSIQTSLSESSYQSSINSAPPIQQGFSDFPGRSVNGAPAMRKVSNNNPPVSEPKPLSPDALPPYPVPTRPGHSERAVQPPKPPPIRHYDNPSASSHKRQASSSQGKSARPVTAAELEQLQAAIDANPSDYKRAMLLVKKLVEASTVLASDGGRADPATQARNRERYIMDADKRLRKIVAAGYPEAQFYLADCYGSGALGLKNEPREAFKLYQAAAKAGHAQAAYRTAMCCELGPDDGGTSQDPAKAMQWYQRGAALGDADAMFKVGIILLKGLLGQPRNVGEAVTFLKRAAERSGQDNPQALYELANLYESGQTNPEIRSKIVPDDKYAFELLQQAGAAGHRAAQFRLGQAFEYGQLGATIDNRASITWYTKAAAQGEHQAELALSGWYLTGADGILQQSDTEAYLWARKAAASEPPLAKAMFAMGHFTETGIGCPRSLDEAKKWYARAAAYRFPKAQERLEELKRSGSKASRPVNGKLTRKDQKRDEENCVIM